LFPKALLPREAAAPVQELALAQEAEQRAVATLEAAARPLKAQHRRRANKRLALVAALFRPTSRLIAGFKSFSSRRPTR
jgi:hypothetical protein